MDIVLGKVIPGAPLGVLGYFIGSKLKEYVEPERAGTPKGESIGLSRKKYHAALLSLTSLSLRKQAKQIGVSYGVLRKWRTEEAFDRCIVQLTEDFVKGPFHTVAAAAMKLLNTDVRIEVHSPQKLSIDEAASIKSERIPGLDDARLYSENLVNLMLRKWLNADVDVPKTGIDYCDDFYRGIAWVLPLNRILEHVDPSNAETWQRAMALRLGMLQRVVLSLPPHKYQLAIVERIAHLIVTVLKDK